MTKIPLQDLKEVLNRKDIRAIRKWCDDNSVFIFERSTKAESVSKIEFALAQDKKFIEHLKNKIGEGWADVYRMYKDENITALSTLNKLVTPQRSFKPIESKNKLIQELQTKLKNHAKITKKR